MGNSDNRKRGVNSRQNEKNREALIAVLTVCLIGVLVTVVIIAAVDLYRKHTYTAEIDPSEYKIIKIEKKYDNVLFCGNGNRGYGFDLCCNCRISGGWRYLYGHAGHADGDGTCQNPVWTLSDGFEPGRGAGEALLFTEEAIPYRQIWR